MSTPESSVRLDRRVPAKGDQRREALLDALDELLKVTSLDEINIADITARAGVTRPAFYFYFENKAYAVAALMAKTYEEVAAVAQLLVSDEGSPTWRIEETIRRLFAALARHPHLYRAMLEARATNAIVRDLWDAYQQSFVEPVAALIRAERDAGRASDGPDAAVLALALLDLNDRALARHLSDSHLTGDAYLSAVVTVWLRAIFGTAKEQA